jgi:DNA-binding NarL/FixJ family response regulator
MAIRVAAADRDYVVAQAIARSLEAEPDITITGVYTASQALFSGLGTHPADVLVLDPAGLTTRGATLIGKVRARFPQTHLIVVTASRQEQDLAAALRAGVRGYLCKSVSMDQLLSSIRAVGHGLGALGPERAVQLMKTVRAQWDNQPGLTPRQHELLRGIVQGKTNQDIACELCLREKTVKNYMQSLFSTLGVHTRTEAVVRVFQMDLISEREWFPPEEATAAPLPIGDRSAPREPTSSPQAGMSSGLRGRVG